MQTKVKLLKDSEAELFVELDKEELREYLKKTGEKISGLVKFDGFRPGKTPLDVVRKEIGDFVIGHCVKFGKTGYVIGLSGGVDSTACAAVINRRFHEHNTTSGSKLELVGYILPSNTNKPEDTRDGISVAERLGIRYEVIPIDGITQAHVAATPSVTESIYHKGNLMSRIRANILSTTAALENKLVAGTGNKDEDFGIGYYTLFGDGAVHISPIGNLSKRLVRQIACYFGFEEIAKRIPTAGLEPGQTDYKDLGYDYDVVELVSEGFSWPCA